MTHLIRNNGIFSHRRYRLAALCAILLAAIPLLRGISEAQVDQVTGAFTTQIPLDIPQYYGITPGLQLVYNSSAGNGYVGLGWSLTGISTIQRARPGGGVPHYDNAGDFCGATANPSKDILMLDGVELTQVANCQPDGTGGVWHTRIESYKKIVQCMTDEGEGWCVTDPAGTKFTYSPKVATGRGVYLWMLTHVEDTNGHEVSYHYDCPSISVITSKFTCYPASIEYNKNRIEFSYSVRSDVLKSAVGGTSSSDTRPIAGAVQIMDRILSNIIVRSVKSVRRQYTLTYQLDPISKTSLLTTVQEHGSSTNAALPATIFIYTNQDMGAPPIGVESVTGAGIIAPGLSLSTYLGTADINGDGYDDALWCSVFNGANYRSALLGGPSSGFATVSQLISPTDAELCDDDPENPRIFAEFNNDGLADYTRLLSNPAGQREFWYSNGDGTFRKVAISSRNFSHAIAFGDYDGDGDTDISGFDDSGTFFTQLKQGDSFAVRTTSYPGWVNPDIVGTGIYKYYPTRAFSGDFNGDGITDVAEFWWTDEIYDDDKKIWFFWSNLVVKFFAANGSYRVVQNVNSSLGLVYSWFWGETKDQTRVDILPGDYNGDGKSDFAAITSHPNDPSPQEQPEFFGVFLSTGDGKFQYVHNAWTALMATDPKAGPVTGDFNKDGKTDILFHGLIEPGQLWADAWLLLSDWEGHFSLRSLKDAYPGARCYWEYARAWGDFDGDGSTDCGWISSVSPGTTVEIRSLHSVPGAPSRLEEIRNGFGAVTKVTYQHGRDDPGATDMFNLPLGFNTWVVKDITVNDGLNGVVSSSAYSFAGGRWSYEERRFLGFETVSISNTLTGAVTVVDNYLITHSLIVPENVRVYDSDGILRSETANSYRINQTAAPYWSFLTTQSTTQCDPPASATDPDDPAYCRRSQSNFSYDSSNGNLLERDDLGDVNVTGDERTTRWRYTPNTTLNILGLKTRETVYKKLGSTLTTLQDTIFLYDYAFATTTKPVKGNLTRIIRWGNDGGSNTEENIYYDCCGNPSIYVDAAGRKQTIKYDDVQQIYPVEVCNNLNQCSTFTWNYTFGKIQSSTDPNGRTTTTFYDLLGRIDRIRRPDGLETLYSYFNFGNPAAQHVLQTAPDLTGDPLDSSLQSFVTATYFDGLMRPYRTEVESTILKTMSYDQASSRVKEESAWRAFDEEPVNMNTSYDYDDLGRLIQITRPDGSTISQSYERRNPALLGGEGGNGHLWTVTVDELGRSKTLWTDVYGNLVKVIEDSNGASQESVYTYDVLGRLVSTTDPLGNKSTLSWDSLGRQKGSVDPDLGSWSYLYNADGSLRQQTDANNQVITLTYDLLGRLATKTVPGTLPGQPDQVFEFFYDEPGHGDSSGRLTRQVFPGGSEEYSYEFDGSPSSFKRCLDGQCLEIGLEYDRARRVSTVTYPDGEPVTTQYDRLGRVRAVPGYADSLMWTARNQLQQVQFANGTQANYTYDPQRFWLATANYEKPGAPGSPYFNAVYGSYDAAGQLRQVISSTNSRASLNLDYDDLGRLTDVTGGQSHHFDYNELGNITDNSALGNYTYADPRHVHAVTSAGGQGYSYDLNGNLLSGGGRTIQWDAENRPVSVTGAAGTSTYAYNGIGDRVKQVTPVAGTDTTTYYFGRFADLVKTSSGTQLVKYYYAGDMLIAKYDGDDTYTFFRDQVDSMRVVTDSQGEKVVGYDYTPFGESSVNFTNGNSTFENAYKFGGHIEDEDTGLAFMNARYYDSKLGRFLSADTIAPGLATPQELNRYTYVLNNPLQFIDPSGHAASSLYSSWGSPGYLGWSGSSLPDRAQAATNDTCCFPHGVFFDYDLGRQDPTYWRSYNITQYLIDTYGPTYAGRPVTEPGIYDCYVGGICNYAGGGNSLIDSSASLSNNTGQQPKPPPVKQPWTFAGAVISHAVSIASFTAGLRDALLPYVGELLFDNYLVDRSSTSYKVGALLALLAGVSRLAYAVLAKGLSVAAVSGAQASILRAELKPLFRLGVNIVRNSKDYATDALLRAAAGRTNPFFNIWGAAATAEALDNPDWGP